MTIEEYLKNPKFGFSEAQIESIGKIADICGIVPMFEALVKKKATVSSKTLEDVRKEETDKLGETRVGKQLREEKKKKKDEPADKRKSEDKDDDVTDEIHIGHDEDRKSYSAFQTDEDYAVSGDSEISDELSDLTDSEDASEFEIDREDQNDELETPSRIDPVLKNLADDINHIRYNDNGNEYTESEDTAADFVNSQLDTIVKLDQDSSKLDGIKRMSSVNAKKKMFLKWISNDEFELTDEDIRNAKKAIKEDEIDSKVSSGEFTPEKAAEAKAQISADDEELFSAGGKRATKVDINKAAFKAFAMWADKFIADLKAYYDKISEESGVENTSVIKSIQIILDIYDGLFEDSASDVVKPVNTADIANALGGTEGTAGTVGKSKDYMKNYMQSILRKKRGV